MGATLLVFANKQDLPGSLSKEEIRDVLQLDNIKTHHWQIVDCSAVTGHNLLAYDWLTQIILASDWSIVAGHNLLAGVDWLLDDISRRIFTLD